MIGKFNQGTGLRGCLNYVLGKKHKILESNFCGRTAREIAKEFAPIQQSKGRLKNTVFHAQIAFAEEDTLPEDLKVLIALEWFKFMGFDVGKNPFILVNHEDGRMHLVTSRKGLDGSVLKDFQMQRKSVRICRDLEKKYGLRQLLDTREDRDGFNEKKEKQKNETVSLVPNMPVPVNRGISNSKVTKWQWSKTLPGFKYIGTSQRRTYIQAKPKYIRQRAFVEKPNKVEVFRPHDDEVLRAALKLALEKWGEDFRIISNNEVLRLKGEAILEELKEADGLLIQNTEKTVLSNEENGYGRYFNKRLFRR